jgi:hypothetical protein
MLTPSSRMRNGLAEDVLDKKMLLLMKVYIVYFVLNSYNYIPCKAGYRFTTPQFFYTSDAKRYNAIMLIFFCEFLVISYKMVLYLHGTDLQESAYIVAASKN